jgi:hypothetical protein
MRCTRFDSNQSNCYNMTQHTLKKILFLNYLKNARENNMPKKNLAVQFPSIRVYVARGNEYVGRNVKCPLFCPILTNKLNSSTYLKFSLP